MCDSWGRGAGLAVEREARLIYFLLCPFAPSVVFVVLLAVPICGRFSLGRASVYYWQKWGGGKYNGRKRTIAPQQTNSSGEGTGRVGLGGDMPVHMELSRIIISDINDQQVIYLKEVEGSRTFPILIGLFEAYSIRRRVNREPSIRPLTHDLVVSVVEQMGGEMQDVVITELKDHTYFARLRVRVDGELLEIDARPSDAIAVAVTCEPMLPIYVSEEVLRDVLGDE